MTFCNKKWQNDWVPIWFNSITCRIIFLGIYFFKQSRCLTCSIWATSYFLLTRFLSGCWIESGASIWMQSHFWILISGLHFPHSYLFLTTVLRWHWRVGVRQNTWKFYESQFSQMKSEILGPFGLETNVFVVRNYYWHRREPR